MTSTGTRWAIEAKVIASTAASAAVGIILAVLNDVQAHHDLLGSTPAWLQALILIVAPPLAAGLAGYQARHTPRPSDDASTTSTPTGV